MPIKKPTTNLSDNLPRILGTTIAKSFTARLGNPADDYKVEVDATDKTGLLYVHLMGDNPNSAFTAENTAGISKLLPGTLVKVKPSENGRFEIIGYASENAEYFKGVQQNDQEPVNRSQILDGGLLPNDASTVQTIGAIYVVDGVVYRTSDQTTGNLIDGSTNDTGASAIQPPSTASKAIMVLVQNNPTTDALSYKQSSEFPASYSDALIASNSLFPNPDSSNAILGYVKLINGMSSIRREHLYSLPDIYRLTSTAVAGSGSSTDNAIVRWNGTGGDTLQDSSITINDNNQLTLPNSATYPPLNVTERSSTPSSPSTGDIYLDDGTNTTSGDPGWRRYTGSVWEDLGAGGGTGGGENNYLVMKLLSGSVVSGKMEWGSNCIDDSNYWGSGDPEKLLCKEATGYDYVMECGGTILNNSGSSDETLTVTISEYNSSDVKQSEIASIQYHVPSGASAEVVSWHIKGRIQQGSLVTGEYLALEVSNTGAIDDTWCNFYEFVSTQVI